MRKKVLKRIALLAAPIIWRKIRGRLGHHHRRHPWHRSHHHGHKRRRVWL